MGDTWQHHGIYQEERAEQARACTYLWISNLIIPSLIPPEHQLRGAAQGLRYLRDANLTHGDLEVVRDSTPSNLFPIVSYSAVGKHPHNKSRAPSGMPREFWIHDNGA